MDSSRNDLIRDILTVFDTIDNLRYDNLVLRERLRSLEAASPEEVTAIGQIDERVMERGRKEIVKKALDYWHNVHYYDDEDGGVRIETYGEWLDHAVKRSDLPDWCSWDDFVDYFAAELQQTYAEEHDRAVAKANER